MSPSLVSLLYLFHPKEYEINCSRFYGAVVNVTPLPFMPFWGEVEVQTPDGTTVTQYEGSDYQMLLAVSAALNFTFRVLPSSSWAEVSGLRYPTKKF